MSGVHVSTYSSPSSLSPFLSFLPPSRSLLSQGMGMPVTEDGAAGDGGSPGGAVLLTGNVIVWAATSFLSLYTG
uniref:Uncharacterized protein n=1 Tax=Oryza glumipatula TaxID=40148 RepID=A0A0E0AJL7_9ORYZ